MYTLIYDDLTGKIYAIRKGDTTFAINPNNADFQDFLVWNAEQKTPLDLDSTIEVEVVVPPPSADERMDRLLITLEDKAVLTKAEADAVSTS